MATKHISDIKFTVGLDENKVPENITWTAEDGGIKDQESKAQNNACLHLIFKHIKTVLQFSS